MVQRFRTVQNRVSPDRRPNYACDSKWHRYHERSGRPDGPSLPMDPADRIMVECGTPPWPYGQSYEAPLGRGSSSALAQAHPPRR